MTQIPLETGLLLAAIIFLLGFTGVMIRRNIIFMLVSIEIMMNATILAFIVASTHLHDVDGQVMALFIFAVAAAEVAIGLALVVQIYRKYSTLDIKVLNKLKD